MWFWCLFPAPATCTPLWLRCQRIDAGGAADFNGGMQLLIRPFLDQLLDDIGPTDAVCGTMTIQDCKRIVRDVHSNLSHDYPMKKPGVAPRLVTLSCALPGLPIRALELRQALPTQPAVPRATSRAWSASSSAAVQGFSSGSARLFLEEVDKLLDVADARVLDFLPGDLFQRALRYSGPCRYIGPAALCFLELVQNELVEAYGFHAHIVGPSLGLSSPHMGRACC